MEPPGAHRAGAGAAAGSYACLGGVASFASRRWAPLRARSCREELARRIVPVVEARRAISVTRLVRSSRAAATEESSATGSGHGRDLRGSAAAGRYGLAPWVRGGAGHRASSRVRSFDRPGALYAQGHSLSPCPGPTMSFDQWPMPLTRLDLRCSFGMKRRSVPFRDRHRPGRDSRRPTAQGPRDTRPGAAVRRQGAVELTGAARRRAEPVLWSARTRSGSPSTGSPRRFANHSRSHGNGCSRITVTRRGTARRSTTTAQVRIRSLFARFDRAGLYAPGGMALYPSSVLMCAAPAKVAGVSDLVLCVPPGPDGTGRRSGPRRGRDRGDRRGPSRRGCPGDRGNGIRDREHRARRRRRGPGNRYVAEAKRQVAGNVGVAAAFAGPVRGGRASPTGVHRSSGRRSIWSSRPSTGRDGPGLPRHVGRAARRQVSDAVDEMVGTQPAQVGALC